ncbi:MAG: hypothetical protein ACI9BF_000455 [Candidatus Paceibacteria bacterium]|jgi:hypothetical protein
MKYGNMTLGRVEALINVLGGESVVRSLLNGTSKCAIETARHLTALTTHDVVGYKYNPLDFFKTRKGLRTSDNFQNFILAAAEDGVVETSDVKIGHADLAQAANDAEIDAELPEGHVFDDVNDFLGRLGTLIDDQWGGKDGVLLNTGYRANILYVKGVNGKTFAVRVYWNSGGRWWHCYALRLDDGRWNADSRVFSATAA